MNLNLDGKVVVVTGASRGIGLACAKAFAAERATVVLVSRDAGVLAKSCREIVADGGMATFIAADLTQSGSEDAITREAMSQLGRIDILVNCAGDAQGGDFWTITDAEWHRNLELKLFATIRMTRAASAVMRLQKSGRIINVVGSAGRTPEAHLLPVSVANAGLLAFTRGLADQLAPEGIAIMAVNPGAIRTERFLNRLKGMSGHDPEKMAELELDIANRTPLKRVGDPSEIAAWVTFMASDRAAHATGLSVTVDGGLSKAPG